MRAETGVLVVGGGPAGSLAAALLAREGVDVTLVEKERFPRYHIGESLLTSALPILDFVGALDRVERHGFVKKHGGYFRVKQGEVPGHIDFTKQRRHKHSYQVVRSEFDHILLDHAAASGADTHQETLVTDVELREGRPVAARLRGPRGAAQPVRFGHMVDASGQAGLLSSRCFSDRRAEEAFANVALGTYVRGARPYRDHHGVERPGAFSMEALTDGSGWTWAIPLHDGRLSVGVVVHRDTYRARRRDLGSDEAVFAHALRRSPDVTALVRDATRDGALRVWRDYSYFAGRYAGPGFRLAGDAAGFIDPLFSTGVHMAFLGGLSAAATICSELRGEMEPAELEAFHHRVLSQSYTRLMITVAGFYQQLRRQDAVVLPGVAGEDFQRAFDLVGPVVSGALDLDTVEGGELPEEAVRGAMRFMADAQLEAHQLDTGDEAARFMNSDTMDDERVAGRLAAVDGCYIRMRRGRLGVARLRAPERALARVRRRLVRAVVRRKARASRC